MKNFILSLLMLSLVVTACGDDDNSGPACDTTDVTATLAGDWTETPLLGVGDEVTFNSDLTGSCTEESLFSTEVNGNVSTTFTWAVNADNTAVTLDYPNGISVEYNVVSVECDEITLELFGFNVKLTRK